ncbi:hypothetical protein HPB51_027510 [Rhipicephalus microplus]|uniref:ISXO2-like transposase domain-containing protein n=1 Tax=Rhipicephalus microplus TaxID=6941 RepID=A0A9J6D003_RHIMP|nr:hypothetical protein HPB51_027510 [Rhipicephalus microplus]
MATPQIDPSLVEIADIIRYPAAEEAFLREIGLSPAPSLRPAVRPQAAGTTMGRPPTSEYWGICKDLCFNPDVLGHPNVKLSRREIIWLTYTMVKGFSSRNTRELTEKEFKLSNTTRTDWRNYIREVALEELRAQPAMGGVGEVVQIDECLLRGRRKANRGRLLTGDSVPPRRRNNYGGVSNKGPWIFGMLHVSTKELRLFQVDKRDAATLGSLIAKHILPGTTVYSDEWAEYQCIPRLVDANGTPLNLDWHTVNHSVNFVDPTTGANTQRIESEWQKAKRRLVRNSNKTTTSLMPAHLAWLWWKSINARPNVKDPFLRLMEVWVWKWKLWMSQLIVLTDLVKSEKRVPLPLPSLSLQVPTSSAVSETSRLGVCKFIGVWDGFVSITAHVTREPNYVLFACP